MISIRQPFTEAPATRNMTLPCSIFNKPALFEESNSIANISNRQKVRKKLTISGYRLRPEAGRNVRSVVPTFTRNDYFLK